MVIISLVTATTVILIITIYVVVTASLLSPQQYWFAEAILRKRFVAATKSFSPCSNAKMIILFFN